MANWRRPCSCRHRVPAEPALRRARLFAAPLALLAVACGHAGDSTVEPRDPSAQAPSVAAAQHDPSSAARPALCMPADEGSLRARLQGALEAEIDWAGGVPQCKGGLRPDGDGVRLIYKGNLPEGPLLVVIGIGPLRAGESARDVPVNLTLVREGTGRFYATQGNDKCAMDDVRQEPAGEPQVYRLTGRGYCIQPARAVGGDGAVLMSRFDVMALVDYR
jgi:hypothetical protein